MALNPADRFADTATAHLRLNYAEALLCKYARAWSPDRIDEYRAIKGLAQSALSTFGMKPKTARLERLEHISELF